MSKRHELKCIAPFYEAVLDGSKRFEVRRNDRRFQPGDTLLLREYRPDMDIYLGREIEVYVRFVLHNHEGLRKGFVVMGIEPLPVGSRKDDAE